MDQRRFDSLTRALAAPKTRRGLLGSLAALGAGLLGARSGEAQVTQAQCGNKICAANPGVCTNGCVCCVYGNGNSRCRPPGECSGTVVSPTTTTAAPTTTQAPTTTTTAAPTTTTTTTTTTTAAPATGQRFDCSCADGSTPQDCRQLACSGQNVIAVCGEACGFNGGLAGQNGCNTQNTCPL